MRIGFVCSEYPPAPHGGIGVFVRTLARQLADLGHVVVVVGFDPGVARDVWDADGEVRVLRLAYPMKWPSLRAGRYELDIRQWTERTRLAGRVAQTARAERLDLVESFDWSGPLWSRPACRLVVRLHGANTALCVSEGKAPSRALRFFERRNVAAADSLVAVSQHIGRATLDALGLSGLRFEVIYNGIDTARFRPADGERDPDEVLYVGAISRRKGVPDLLEAFPLVLREHPVARLRLVGRLRQGTEGEAQVRELLATVPEEFRRAIRFEGVVPHGDLPAAYRRAAVVVVPSRAEAFGYTCAEAMACGTPTVVSSLASGPELVTHEVTGLLADPREPKALAAAINRLLSDGGMRRAIGEAASQAARAFDIHRIAERNIAFYEGALAGQEGARGRVAA